MVKRHRRRVRSLRLATAALAGALLISAQRAGAQEAKPPEPKKGWETVANVGVTLTRGNSRNFLASAGMNSSRKWPTDEILLGANAGYGETTLRQSGPDTKHTTEQYIKGFSQYNHLFNERIYGGLRVNGVYDKVAGVHYRFTVSPMAGYYLIKKPSTLLSVEVGPSFITEAVVSG